ncbi:tetratricopeptide repeat protein [Chondromyces apiculatus]|uniref:Uncharacterized protein n=1 Tax=Chondromyces apiculatus DSM 436 TaxID=1192034 RepID=A0A017T8X7_9BACT|nr:tetratricopeptide repeat protein [Chondromyces apiculatus]EYF05718.1 Hypothetical protein CAP_3008 [Chondromyces apiculatus DSM 436]
MAADHRRGTGARALERAPNLRAPAVGPRRPPSEPDRPRGDRPLLRLALNRGALALELAEPFQLGPFSLTELVVRIPGLRFPLDLSGGVTRFRHRRGELERLVVEIRGGDLSTWAMPRMRGLLGTGPVDLLIAPLRGDEGEGGRGEGGRGEGGRGEGGRGGSAPRPGLPGSPASGTRTPGVLVALRVGEAALAFDVIIAPGERDLRLIPERARGVGLGAPPQALALRALLAGAGPGAQILGGAVVLPDAVARVVRDAMPAAGARAPAVDAVRWAGFTVSGTALRFEATAHAPPPALADRALSALEAAEIAGEGDRAALAGDLDAARLAYLSALERAPRHREVATRVAWIDCVVGERAEAALATLVEAMPAVDAGLLGAELLEAVGDREAALAALERAAHDEPYGPLSALGWLRAARLCEEPWARLRALDEGVTRAPLLAELRWARLEARLDVADARGALADAEHLEAATRGAEARHAVWRRAAEAYLSRGHTAEARRLFERALRYAPDSPEAALGLGRSLRAAGEGRRALDLLARARALAERRGRAVGALDLELARGLAEIAGDRPAAIARVHGIPAEAAEALEARLLEGRWRAELGDPEGASLCLSRLRAAVEVGSAGMSAGPEATRVAAMLVEAAEIEERERGDLLAAQRHLGLAMRLSPRNRAFTAEFRRVTAELKRPAPVPASAPVPEAGASYAGKASHVDEEPQVDDEDLHQEEPSSDRASQPVGATLGDPAPLPAGWWSQAEEAPALPEEASAEDEQQVERLTDRLRANPHDQETTLALAALLAKLGRDLDLLALLSARIEEGDDAVREELTPLRHEVLLRLAAQARAAGRHSEAELYEMMRDMP